MKRKAVLKRIGIIAAVVVGIIACVIAVAQIILQSRTSAIMNDISGKKPMRSTRRPFISTELRSSRRTFPAAMRL